MAKEYIEREAAIKAVCYSSAHTCDFKNCFRGCQEAHAILAIPAADVVPVVRCRNCKHYDNGWCHRVHNPAQYSKTTDDWFCADGARMEGDGE